MPALPHPTANWSVLIYFVDRFFTHQLCNIPLAWRLVSLHVKVTVSGSKLNWYDCVIGAEIPWMHRRLFGGSSLWFPRVATGWPFTTEVPSIGLKINYFLASTFLFMTKPASWIAKIRYRSYKYRRYGTDILTMRQFLEPVWTNQPRPQILRSGIRRCVSIFQVMIFNPQKSVSLWVLVGSGMLKHDLLRELFRT